MTKKYFKTFSNGVTCNLKITATTGRPGTHNDRLAGYRREPASEMAATFRGKCEPEEVEAVQAEFDQWLRECSIDAGRHAGGILTFKTVPVPVHEIRKGYPADADQEANREATESDLDARLPGSSEGVAANGEVVAPGAAPADTEEVGGTNPS